MTKQTEALRMAIEWFTDVSKNNEDEVIQACKDALEKPTTEQSSLVQEPKSPTILARLPNGATASNVYEAYEAGLKEGKAETQEPVGYVVPDYEECCKAFNGKTLMSKEKTDLHKIPLYTTPPSREWVSLSDDEITGVWNSLTETQFDFDFARVIEAKLKEKNELFGNSR